jgi:hypothetical protein
MTQIAGVYVGKTPDIRPGMSVDIVLDMDDLKETIDVRRSLVYEVDGNTLIMSQTTPALSRRHLGKKLIVTFLSNGENGPVRSGCFAKRIEFDGTYKLFSGVVVDAIALVRTTAIKRDFLNLRMHHRLNPGPKSGIEITIGKIPVNIIDISIGGAKFSYDNAETLEAGATVDAAVSIDDETFRLRAKVLRAWSSQNYSTRELTHYGVVHFEGVNRRLNFLLGGKIFAIERERMSRGLISEVR